MQALGAVYGAAATWRRRWYARDARRTRRLARPVISVGNLRVGGSGKTPVVAELARLLLARGERPAILSRGYGRTATDAGVTVVSDGTRVLADLAHAGDEPLLLARAIPGVTVVVCPDRHRAGLEAERLGATVHLLDDGFQHLRLARDLDLLLVDAADLADRVLPAGRLREPLANAAAADAVLVTTTDVHAVQAVASALRVAQAFQVVRAIGQPARVGDGRALPSGTRLFATAGIARPERFFDDLRTDGWDVAGTRAFRDHHRFDASDVAAIQQAARDAGAAAIVTTEKDATRLQGLLDDLMPWAVVPLSVRVEPAAAFDAWVRTRLDQARTHDPAGVRGTRP